MSHEASKRLPAHGSRFAFTADKQRDRAIYATEIADYAAAGCKYLQIDDVSFAYLCDPKYRETFVKNGDDPEKLLRTYAGAINRAIAGRPADMAVTTHTCRGNFKSTFMAIGGYDAVAETVFTQIETDGFFLEYDDGEMRHVFTGYSEDVELTRRGIGNLLGSSLLKGDVSPQMFHQPNLRDYNGAGNTLLGDLLDAVANNTVECGHTYTGYYIGKNPALIFDGSLPFGLTPRMQNAWMMYGNGRKLMDEIYDGFGVVALPAGQTGGQMFGWFRKELKSVKDFEGLKMRTAGFGGKVMAKLGVIPQQIAGGDIYPALERGTIDACEWVGPYDDEKLGFNKVAKYYYYPGWWEGGAELEFFINTKAYAALSPEYKAMVETAASHAHVEMQARYDARNPLALKQLVAAKTELVQFPKPVLEAAFKHSMDIYSELNEKNPAWRKVYADYSKFRADQNLWFRFTEGTFDRFMQSAKL